MNRLAIASLVAAAFAQGAAAQEMEMAPHAMEPPAHLAAAEDAGAQADAWKRWADDFSREMRTSMGSLFANRVVSHRLVKGAPYSARIVTELNQPLADGNIISHKREGAVYRDNEGRTRQEIVGDGGKRTSVVIDDPVEHKHFVLMPEAKRAIETTARVREGRNHGVEVVNVDGKKIRVEDGKVSIDGKDVVVGDIIVVKSKSGKEVRVENGRVTIDGKDVAEISGDAQRHVVVKTMSSPEGSREEVRVQVVRPGDAFDIAPPLPPVPPIPGVETMRFENMGRLGKGVTTSLGTRNFDGVAAEGKQTTWTIPAGEIGNRNPVVVTSESWLSPELQVTVYSRYNDPRTGESIYRLAGIKRGEPSPELFRVPADYQVKSRAR